MKLTEDLKKFLASDWGQKVVMSAYALGAETFVYGKQKYQTRELKRQVDVLKLNTCASQKETSR